MRLLGKWHTCVVLGALAGFWCCSPFGGANGGSETANGGDGGAGSDGGDTGEADGGCLGGSCSSEVLVSGQLSPWQIALDDLNVYVTNQGPPGSVVTFPKSGGTATVLATGEDAPDGIAVDATTVYWGAAGAVRKVAKTSPGAPSNFAAASPSRPTTLLLNGGKLYWFESTDESLFSCATPVCSTPSDIMRYQAGGVGIASSGTGLYWTAGRDKGYVATCGTCPESNQPPPYVQTGLLFPQGIAFSDGYVFLAAGADANGSVLAITAAPDAGAPIRLADGQNRPFSVATDGQHVYFTTRGSLGGNDGTVMRVDKSGKNLTPVATGLANPAWLALDADFVYWTNPDDGTVRRKSKN